MPTITKKVDTGSPEHETPTHAKPSTQRFYWAKEPRDGRRSELGELEEAVLDLAARWILAVIPESDLEIYGALESLLGRRLIRVEQ